MATVTVSGASGTVAIPFKSTVNASFAQQLANQISTAIKNGTLTGTPYNPSGAPVAGGPLNELVIGGSVPGASGAASYTLPNSYAAIVSNSTNPVTVTAGASPVAPLSVLGGEGGTTFFASSTIGGSLSFGGGKNVVAGSATFTGAQDSSDGGLNGQWTISSGAASGSSANIVLATGKDTVIFGGGDTVQAGGASVLAFDSNTDAVDPTFFIGSAPSTVFGLASPNLDILGQGASGGGVYVLGTGGNGVIAAGAGNTTLVGGGNGDVLFANTTAGAQAVFYAGAGGETLQGSYSGGNSTLYGGSGPDVIAGGSGNDVIEVGSGNDSLFTGLGQDSVWFYAPTAKAVKDVIYDFHPDQGTLIFQGYTGYTVTSTGSAPLTITLSDSSQITFNNLTTAQASTLKITTIT